MLLAPAVVVEETEDETFDVVDGSNSDRGWYCTTQNNTTNLPESDKLENYYDEQQEEHQQHQHYHSYPHRRILLSKYEACAAVYEYQLISTVYDPSRYDTIDVSVTPTTIAYPTIQTASSMIWRIYCTNINITILLCELLLSR